MSFKQNIHLEQDVEGRIDLYWDFKPSTGYVNSQRFAVMSIVCPEGTTQTAASFGIKVFGCFETLAEANAYAKQLQRECDAFDYYAVETQCWAKLPPQIEKLDDRHYQEEELESLKTTLIKTREAKVKILEERILADKAQSKMKNAADSLTVDAPEAMDV
jgi:hypothetical protein